MVNSVKGQEEIWLVSEGYHIRVNAWCSIHTTLVTKDPPGIFWVNRGTWVSGK